MSEGSDAQKSSILPLVLILLAGGLFLRLFWVEQLLGGPGAFEPSGEATNIAMALAEGRGFSDAYAPGSGPTAHLSPAVVLIPAFILWMFGPDTAAANAALLAWCLLQVSAVYLLAVRLFSRLGINRSAILLAVGMLTLVPVYIEQEAMDFRWWEGATALNLALLHLNLLIGLKNLPVTDRELGLVGALLGLTAFLSPPVGLAAGACWTWFAFRYFRPIQFGKVVLGATLILLLMVVPWAMRNQQQLGRPVALRSNVGLELALANHTDATSNRPKSQVLIDRGRQIHPFWGPSAREALRSAGGEVPYFDKLSSEARGWILSHPLEFARLSLRHLMEFYFPRPWQFEYSAWESLRPWRAHWISLINLAGLAALGFRLKQRRSGFGYIAIYVAVVALPYAVVQPVPRYTYLIYPILAFLACDGAVALLKRLRSIAESDRTVRQSPSAGALRMSDRDIGS